MRVIVDSREQAPFPFRGPRYEGVTVEVGALSVGDYSLAGLADKVAVERKELSDLVACLGRERERFERELARGAALDAFCVVVEASWADLAGGQYRSRMNPHAACQSVAAFMGRYRLPFLFAGSRSAAASLWPGCAAMRPWPDMRPRSRNTGSSRRGTVPPGML